MTDQLAADPISVLQRFSDEVELACPLFQRRYIWKSDNINQLWADIDTVLDGEYGKRFLGALVFNNESAPTASKAGRYWIIDGQQRLTTLYLCLVALAQEAGESADPQGKEFGQDIFSSYLVSSKSQSKHLPKFRPTLVDTKQFQQILLDAAQGTDASVDVNPTLAVGDEDGAMSAGYKCIRTNIQRRLTDHEDSLSTLTRIRDTLLELLEMVEIRLGDEHDPNEVFDRLNKEGERLSISDLVRNEVLRHLDAAPHAAQKVFSQYWKPFEQGFPNPTACTKYFFPFALTIDPQTTQAKTFKMLATHWRDLTADCASNEDRVKMMVNDLQRHRSSYNAIASGNLDLLDEPLRERVRRLHALRASAVTYPYIMQLITAAEEGDISANDAAVSLGVVESFLVRRALCGIEPTGLHAVFKTLWGNAGAIPAEVRSSLITKTVNFPGNPAFEKAVREGDLYHRKIRNYVLEEYERDHTSGDIMKAYPEMTVDHLAPQSLGGAWETLFKTEADRALIHTWGNLVPLSGPANSTKGAKDWHEARSQLQHETVFSTTKHVYASNSSWGPENIQARNLDLWEWASARWPEYE